METQIKTSVKAELASSTFPTVVVEQILMPQSGSTKGRTVLARWVTEPRSTGGANGLLGLFLGPLAQRNNEQRVGLQFMANEVIDRLKLDVGVNINEALRAAGEAPIRLSVSEITKSEYDNLDANAQIPYNAKINPSTGEVLCVKGEPIYRKVYFDTVDGKDDYLAHDGSSDQSDSIDV